MPTHRPKTTHHGLMLGRIWYGTSENGGFEIVIQTPLFGFVFGRKYPAWDRDGITSHISFGLLPNIFDTEGSMLYKFNWEKQWNFVSTQELSNVRI